MVDSFSISPFVYYNKTDTSSSVREYSFNSKGNLTKISRKSFDAEGNVCGKGVAKFSYDKNDFLTSTFSTWSDNDGYQEEIESKLKWEDSLLVSIKAYIKSSKFEGEVETQFEYSDESQYANVYNQMFEYWFHIDIYDEKEREYVTFHPFVDYTCCYLGAMGTAPIKLPESSTTYYDRGSVYRIQSMFYRNLGYDEPVKTDLVEYKKLDHVRKRIDW